jgi:predicted phage-related endonuclease
MTNTELERLVDKMNEWEELMNEAKKQATFYEEQIKAELTRRDVEEVVLDSSIIRWVEILSQRFDTKRFKEKYSELYKEYTKQVPSRRFTVSF